MNSRKRPASQSGSSTPIASQANLPNVNDAVHEHDESMINSIPLSSSPTGQATVRNASDGHQNGTRKRQAQGQAASPQPYVHIDDPTDTGNNLIDMVESTQPESVSAITQPFTDSPVSQQQTTTTTTDVMQESQDSNNPIAASNNAQRSKNLVGHSFAFPGPPQSARHFSTTNVSSPTTRKATKADAAQTSNTAPSPTAYTSNPISSPNASRTKSGTSNSGTIAGQGNQVGTTSGGNHSGSGSGSGSSGADQFSNSSSGYQYQRERVATGPASASVRPPSRFANYSDNLIDRKQYSNVNMMDLDESLRALYFAPIPIVVLDHTRTVKMLNKPAETVLGITDANAVGQRLERFIAPSFRRELSVALNEAAQRIGNSSRSNVPYATQLAMQSADDGPTVTADVNISAWFATDPIFSAANHLSNPAAAASSEPSPSSVQSPSSPYNATPTTSASRSGPSQGASLPVHEAMFTLTILPAKAKVREGSPSLPQSQIAATLKNAIFENLDKAIMVVSKDLKVVIQNEACREMLRSFRGGRGLEPTNSSGESDGLQAFAWISEAMTVWDEKFEHPLEESEWPIYRCVIMGQPKAPVTMGLIDKLTGERIILQIDGKPLRDQQGFGEHIGGLIVLRNVTAERSRLRQEAKTEGDLYFKQTCDAMPQLVWVTSPTGYHEWYSKSWYDYTGTNEETSRGVGWQVSIHEEDFPEAAKRWSYSLRTGDLYETAYRIKRGDGIWRWFLGRALPMRDTETGIIQKWFGTCTDIHDQVEALANSRRAQSQLESVINHAAMTIWATDREGRITIAEGPGVRQLKLLAPGTPGSSEKGGNSVQRMLEDTSEDDRQPASNSNSNSASQGQAKQQMVGRSVYTIWDPALIAKSMEKALAGETVVEEMEIEGRWFRTSYTPMRADNQAAQMLIEDATFEDMEERGEGEIIGVVGASLDITDRKRAQEKVEESLMEKTRALAAEGAAREASRLKSEFLANMSHEIRTPIAGVIGLSELLLDEKGLTPQQRDYAETIQRSAEGLLTVINDVLDFSKVEIGKLDVEKAPFNLEVLLRDAKRMLSFATQKKGLEFREAVELTYKGQVLGDMGRLRQVITNLLTNAIKFTAHGFISLEVTELSEDTDNLIVKFDVRDSGCGIKPDTLGRLFQPFSQADPSTARRFGGTGLGLSISKNLVELMNGEIGLDSVEGDGSHAWFVIPFRKATESEKAAAIAAKAEARTANVPGNGFSLGTSDEEKMTMMRPRKDIWILIAEDNLVNAQIASKNIKRMGFNCRTAENGLKALEELEKNTYDAILMDCQMPECDGYEATRMIRKSLNPDTRMLPIIALTASAIKGDRERALEAGMVDYLAKPVKRPALEATLCKWLYDGDARQSLSQFMVPAAEGSSAASIHAALNAMRQPLLSASATSSGSAVEFPFPEVLTSGQGTGSQSVSFAIASEAMSPSTTNRLANVRLSPPSEAVIERLKMPDELLGTEALSLFRSGDALSAAAVLLSARRSSAEDVERLKKDSKNKRPLSSPRSISFHGKEPKQLTENIHPRVTFADSVVMDRSSSSGGTPTIAPESTSMVLTKNPFPLFRRSSREQAGLGRDLDGEMMRATMDGEPALHEAMSSGDDVSMQNSPTNTNTPKNVPQSDNTGMKF